MATACWLQDEIHIEVHDGNVLRFGHNPRAEREKEDEEEQGIFHRAERVRESQLSSFLVAVLPSSLQQVGTAGEQGQACCSVASHELCLKMKSSQCIESLTTHYKLRPS
jgi:hypothetical protein